MAYGSDQSRRGTTRATYHSCQGHSRGSDGLLSGTGKGVITCVPRPGLPSPLWSGFSAGRLQVGIKEDLRWRALLSVLGRSKTFNGQDVLRHAQKRRQQHRRRTTCCRPPSGSPRCAPSRLQQPLGVIHRSDAHGERIRAWLNTTPAFHLRPHTPGAQRQQVD